MEGINCLEFLVDGQKEGLACLYKLFARDLFRYGMSLCKNENEVSECLHDFFLYLWESRNKLSGIKNPKSYLLISFKRRLIKQINKLSTYDEIDLKYERNYFEESDEEKLVKEEIADENLKRLSKAMNSLSGREREVIHLKYYEKYSNEEIAEILEINYQSVRNLLYRAIQNLRKKI